MAQLSGDPRVNQYTAAEGQTIFIYDYKVYGNDEIDVQQEETILTLSDDYTVDDVGDADGGTITLIVGASAGDLITLTGNTKIERETTFTEGGDFLASAINGEYDRLDNIDIELLTEEQLSLRFPHYIEGVDPHLPLPEANKAFKWNATATALINTTYDPDAAQTDSAASAAAALVSELAAAASAVTAAEEAAAAAISAAAALVSQLAAAASAAIFDFEAVDSDILPETTATYDLGSSSKVWSELHVGAITADSISIDSDTIDPITYYADFVHEETTGTDGGGITATTWTKRPINTTIANTITGCSIASDQITLDIGNYEISCSAVAHSCFNSFIRLYNTTTTTELIRSTSFSADDDVRNVVGMFKGIITIGTDDTVLEVQQISEQTQATDGMGFGVGLTGITERFLSIFIKKIPYLT